MKNLLVINSSSRILRSNSRSLTKAFVDHWSSIHTNSKIVSRELGNAAVPHITDGWIGAAFKPEEARSEADLQALEISNEYIAELQEADVIVIGTPMYNWSIPSALKAYIDQILRINVTWKIDPSNIQNPYVGLLKNKTLYLMLSRGAQGYEKGEYNAHMNFQNDYLKTVFNVMGIYDIHVVAINGESFDPGKFEQSIKDSHQKVKELIELQLV